MEKILSNVAPRVFVRVVDGQQIPFRIERLTQSAFQEAKAPRFAPVWIDSASQLRGKAIEERLIDLEEISVMIYMLMGGDQPSPSSTSDFLRRWGAAVSLSRIMFLIMDRSHMVRQL